MLKCSQFAEYALGLTLWDKQKEIVDEYFNGTKTHGVWALGRRCVTGDTLISTDQGDVKIAELAERGEIVTLEDGSEWRTCSARVAQLDGSYASAELVHVGEIEPTRRITLANGLCIAGTPEHPIMVMGDDGAEWKELQHIKTGDLVFAVSEEKGNGQELVSVIGNHENGLHQVFDLHVPSTNAFIGNGICNHNSGKTLLAAVAALYVCFVLEERYRRKVRKKEKWYVVTIANDQSQAKLALNNIRQLLIDSQFAKEITRETATEIEISNGCVFQAIPASARASRGKAVVMVIMDELAFSIEGDANRGAKAIYTALSPSIAQFGGDGRILELSSPWLTDGLFYEHYCEAQSGEYKFMQAINIPTWEINPNLPWGCNFLEAELKRDPEKFWVEYGAQFSKNLSALLAPEVVEAAVDKKRGILLPQRDFQGTYYLALDPAKGGVGRDNYTAAIVHYEGEMLIVDKFHSFDADFEINGKKEVNIKGVEQWIVEHHKAYGFKEIVLDQFNSASTIQTLAEGFPISELTWSVSTKMKAFSKMRQLFNAGLISLYPHEVAIKQIKNLSVVYRQSGQWTVTGGKEANVDDFPFALAAAIMVASEGDDIDWINSLVR